MKILSEENSVLDTDTINKMIYFWILSFRDFKNPDFFTEKLISIEEVESPSIALEIGDNKTINTVVVPLMWSILITDMDTLECIPLHEMTGKTFHAFCMNPCDRGAPKFLQVRTGMIYPKTTWTSPPLNDRDMLVVPINESAGTRRGRDEVEIRQGPVCAIFSPTKMDINKSISDIM